MHPNPIFLKIKLRVVEIGRQKKSFQIFLEHERTKIRDFISKKHTPPKKKKKGPFFFLGGGNYQGCEAAGRKRF